VRGKVIDIHPHAKTWERESMIFFPPLAGFMGASAVMRNYVEINWRTEKSGGDNAG